MPLPRRNNPGLRHSQSDGFADQIKYVQFLQEDIYKLRVGGLTCSQCHTFGFPHLSATMLSAIIILSGIFFFGLATSSPDYCPLLGPVFPPPIHVNKNLNFSAAVKNVSTILEQAVKGDSRLSFVIDPIATSFTLQIFNAKDQSPLFEFYHTSPAVQDYKEGVKHIDENTVFRIGSGSKLITVLLLLIEKGDAVFNEPVANHIPEIREAVAGMRVNTTKQDNAIDFLRWGEVTVGELCSHMSGLPRDCEFLDDIFGQSYYWYIN